MLAAMSAAPAFAASWNSIQADSRLEFVADYEGAEAPGTFAVFTVSLDFDPGAPADASLSVDVNISSAGMDSEDIDRAIMAPEWFDSGAYPHAEFHSDSIRPLGDSEFAADGTLSLKGTTRPLTVPFHWQAQGPFAEMTGHLTVSRTDFDIGSGEWSSGSPIGHDVQVRFKVRLEARH